MLHFLREKNADFSLLFSFGSHLRMVLLTLLLFHILRSLSSLSKIYIK